MVSDGHLRDAFLKFDNKHTGYLTEQNLAQVFFQKRAHWLVSKNNHCELMVQLLRFYLPPSVGGRREYYGPLHDSLPHFHLKVLGDKFENTHVRELLAEARSTGPTRKEGVVYFDEFLRHVRDAGTASTAASSNASTISEDGGELGLRTISEDHQLVEQSDSRLSCSHGGPDRSSRSLLSKSAGGSAPSRQSNVVAMSHGAKDFAQATPSGAPILPGGGRRTCISGGSGGEEGVLLAGSTGSRTSLSGKLCGKKSPRRHRRSSLLCGRGGASSSSRPSSISRRTSGRTSDESPETSGPVASDEGHGAVRVSSIALEMAA